MMTRVAIIGSGHIGCDLLAKISMSESLTCTLFVGQRAESAGLRYAKNLGARASADGIDALLREPDSFDMVFDATSALAHARHAPALEALNKTILNLTPAARGRWCVPTINGDQMSAGANINFITCGGQAAAPIAHALRMAAKRVEYVEVVSSISARSAGPATRQNVSEYLTMTRDAMKLFAGCAAAKAILNINPAEPPVTMQTTVFAKLGDSDSKKIENAVHAAVARVRTYVPGYELIVEPTVHGDRWMAMVRVRGAGAYLPSYSGNLDIITSAAVRVAESIAHNTTSKVLSA